MNDLQDFVNQLTPIDPSEDRLATRAKNIGAALSGKKQSEARRATQSVALSGRKISLAHAQKISEALRNRKRDRSSIDRMIVTYQGKPGTKHFIRAELERNGLDDLPRWPDGKVNLQASAALKGYKLHNFRAAICEFFPEHKPTKDSPTTRGWFRKPKA